MNNSIQAFLILTVRKIKMSSKLQLNLFKTVSSYLNRKSRHSEATGTCDFLGNNETQHETMLTAAEFVILETIVRCYTTLDLKVVKL